MTRSCVNIFLRDISIEIHRSSSVTIRNEVCTLYIANDMSIHSCECYNNIRNFSSSYFKLNYMPQETYLFFNIVFILSCCKLMTTSLVILIFKPFKNMLLYITVNVRSIYWYFIRCDLHVEKAVKSTNTLDSVPSYHIKPIIEPVLYI